MLSFDITDRNVRIIKGAESGGKIRISSAATLNLEEEVIVNGHVKDVPRVATLINGMLKKSKMADKEAIVSISSNLTIFKEIRIPRAKEAEFAKKVKSEMQAVLGIDDSYAISYIIVGDDGEKNEAGEVLEKVLATACPYEIVDCYRKVFQMLGISLKSVMIGCNCITKVLLADTKIRSKMPLLAVQIDPNFISLNLYERGQLTFSRFASIDSADYGNSADYVFEAVNENIFRMLQFHKSRKGSSPIENIVFYGDTREYNRLINELDKMELQAHIISVPPQIYGYENLEFSLYANAIGAMFKRNPSIEKVNLLATESSAARRVKSDQSFAAMLLAVLAGSALLVGGSWFIFNSQNKQILKEIDEINTKITSPDTQKKLKHHERLLGMKEKVKEYKIMVQNANDAYSSQPVILGEKFDKIEKILMETAKEVKTMYGDEFSPKDSLKKVEIKSMDYNSGTMNVMLELQGMHDPAQKIPALFVEKLLKDSMIASVDYIGYGAPSIEETDENMKKEGFINNEKYKPGEDVIHTAQKKVAFNLTIKIKGEKNVYVALEKEAE